ncbi:hypothetical protein DFH08DRAFT_923755 [Mycena albidolilacea]|uniref:Uncharacterized protein n=1 Tax=Mycena albidolilacea TaxID=1033008 RepID=A0AAD7A514_9AGAR|nr:hypothetical protein DFH08DRAFT_923755 [Mycena albidolilacea]
MEDHCGPGHGSYIWGRSVHNTRIERLWYNVMHGFGQNTADIWRLHHLFLDSINRGALEWARSWNSHKLQIKGEHKHSPRDMFVFSVVQDGPHGIGHMLEPVDEPVVDIADYGVDWEFGAEPTGLGGQNPFHPPPPQQLSDVPCDPPTFALLDETLQQRVDVMSGIWLYIECYGVTLWVTDLISASEVHVWWVTSSSAVSA